MATYVYECPFHGRVDVIKPMAELDRVEKCQAYSEPAYGGDLHGIGNVNTDCGMVMTRVFTAPNVIMNPSGDGYFFNKKTGLRSSGKGRGR